MTLKACEVLSDTLLHARLTHLPAQIARSRFVRFELLSDDGEVGFVCRQAKHDEIGVSATKNVLRVGIVIGLGALAANVIHDFVFAFA